MPKKKYSRSERREVKRQLSIALLLLRKVSKKIPISSPRQKVITKMTDRLETLTKRMKTGEELSAKQLIGRIRTFMETQVSGREKWGLKESV